MANEIQFGDSSGLTLTANIYQPDGTIRQSSLSLTEIASTGYYTNSDPSNAVDGDFVIISDSNNNNVGAGEYSTEVTEIKVVTDNMAKSSTTLVSGTVSATAGSTTVFYSDDITEATAGHYNGRIVIFTTSEVGTDELVNQATDITGYELSGGEGKFTVTALTSAPAENDTFVIV